MRDQAESLRQRLQRMKDRTEAKVIAVVSGKGGVGKSNFSLNFAINLSRNKQKVLIFDMDIGMGNIDILMGLPSRGSFVDIFKQGISIQDIIKEGPEGVDFISGGSGLSTLFKLDSEKLSYFLNQLGKLALDYDYILFDMGAGITEDSLQLLLSVHEIFVVTTPEPTAITDAYSMMKYICTKENNAEFYLIVNRALSHEEGTSTLKRLSEVMRQFLKKEIVQLGYLPDDRNVNKAVSRQTPFSVFDPKSKVSIALKEIADRYIDGNSIENGKQKPKSFSFISRLRHYFQER
ncbi:MinD/ParA family protein [Bacillus suaedaesalsae]|uniref:MinD/ParA family protein n=1 Tax=Bacillus suaedaesalsae TaxID=2810349 RepID=A0ABS2DIV7_9BACI|nr:MinD/ParA family protein [Bacillus suaedaesalsae]MBM6618426.1 MinD/ParA family protein [Bacillus suaedaesalsae]